MDIKIDSSKTQTENLVYLLREHGVTDSIFQDIESTSTLENNQVIEGKQYNSELTLHIRPDSPTHYKEKKTYVKSFYNRLVVGFNQDTNYIFVYNEAKYGILDGKKDNEKITNFINGEKHFSQDRAYPFRAELNKEKDRVTIYANLASPCYIGSKEYRIRLRKPVFELRIKEESFLVHPLGVQYKYRNNEYLVDSINANGQTHDIELRILHDDSIPLDISKEDLVKKIKENPTKYFIKVNKDDNDLSVNESLEPIFSSDETEIVFKGPQNALGERFDFSGYSGIDFKRNAIWSAPIGLRIVSVPHGYLLRCEFGKHLPFVVEDILDRPYSIPKRLGKVRGEVRPRVTTDRKNIVIDFVALNTVNDLDDNHVFELFIDKLREMLYGEFRHLYKKDDIPFTTDIITDTVIKNQMGSNTLDVLVKVNPIVESLFFSGPIWVNCVYQDNPERIKVIANVDKVANSAINTLKQMVVEANLVSDTSKVEIWKDSLLKNPDNSVSLNYTEITDGESNEHKTITYFRRIPVKETIIEVEEKLTVERFKEALAKYCLLDEIIMPLNEDILNADIIPVTIRAKENSLVYAYVSRVIVRITGVADLAINKNLNGFEKP